MKRSGKFYRRNESEVMNLLGLKPTKNSGSGWIEKEDGQSEFVICQLKSTDFDSIKINAKDIRTLEYNACVSHKLPIFAIQFLKTNELFIVIRPDLIQDISKYIEVGEYININEFIDVSISDSDDTSENVKNTIRSSSKAREKFSLERKRKFEKEKRSAK